ncbi:PspC domain-containing protein [Paenibacillus arenilitoris]|uniref:PspC domain-containing protein n=1 Tax=Paenibacillus arenilitoris TaxID=2772299 RepID=A0A927CHZ9_9BACL|nr:PspC domain-containing protein [Paenibacillus arenilitoris]MBD2867855.1 PspC domain-containing protein [Paenibacillus arenilitoris]
MVVLKKLYRSSRDKKLFGLCGGLAEMFNVDATLLRILLIVVTIFTSGAVIVIYLIAGLVVPKEPPLYSNFGPNGFGGGYGGGYNGGYNNGYGSQPQFGGPYKNPPQPQGPWNASQQGMGPAPSPSQFDSMMDDLEKKALRREIEELKAKLAKYEKGEF